MRLSKDYNYLGLHAVRTCTCTCIFYMYIICTYSVWLLVDHVLAPILHVYNGLRLGPQVIAMVTSTHSSLQSIHMCQWCMSPGPAHRVTRKVTSRSRSCLGSCGSLIVSCTCTCELTAFPTVEVTYVRGMSNCTNSFYQSYSKKKNLSRL